MVKESKDKERSNFTKYRRDVRLCSDLFTDLVIISSNILKASKIGQVKYNTENTVWKENVLGN